VVEGSDGRVVDEECEEGLPPPHAARAVPATAAVATPRNRLRSIGSELGTEGCYERGRDNCRTWTDTFSIRVPSGHNHSSMECSTCYPTTQFRWLPQLSGLTEAEAVAEHGSVLCSVCYPSARFDWTTGCSFWTANNGVTGAPSSKCSLELVEAATLLRSTPGVNRTRRPWSSEQAEAIGRR